MFNGGESFAAVQHALNSMSDDEFAKKYEFPPKNLCEPCKCEVICSRISIYISGRCLKYSRNVSQTCWMIDDERMGENFVEEIIANAILPQLRGDSYKFHTAARDLERNAKIGSGRGLSAVAMATAAQRRSISDRERVKRWNIYEEMENAWLECFQSGGNSLASVKDSSALTSKYMETLVVMVSLARNMQQREIERWNLVASADVHRAKVGAQSWRRLIRFLVEQEALFGPMGYHLGHPERVYWKLDFMENSLRMRRRLKRYYKGHHMLGASVNYEDHKIAHEHTVDDNKGSIMDTESSLVGTLPATMPMLLPEKSLLDESCDDEGTRSNFETCEDKKDDLEHNFFLASENIPQASEELKSESDIFFCAKEMVDNAEAPGLDRTLVGTVVMEVDERMLLEVPAMMIQPLRLMRGRFQTSSLGVLGRTVGSNLWHHIN